MACDIELGLTATTMYPLSWYGIPDPIAANYVPFSVRRKCGNGQYKGYGHPTITLSWSRMEHSTLWALLGLYDSDTDASRSIYIRAHKDDEALPLATFLAIMVRPIDGSGKQLFPRSMRDSTVNYSSVTLTFEHLEEQ